MGIKKETENLIRHFKKRESFTTSDIHAFFSSAQADIKRATVNWRIYELVRQGILKRIGRGVYAIGKEKDFIPVPEKMQKKVSLLIKKQFPLINFCSWHSGVLSEFYHHIVTRDFVIIETDRDSIEAVYYFLKDLNRNTFREPSRQVIEDFVFDSRDAVIVKALVSEAPLQSADAISVPTIEKILVDLVADVDIFFFLQGIEMLNFFSNVMEKYTINMDRLKRYARRRNRGAEMEKIIDRISGNKKG